jgi:hypothetical protein
MMNSLIIARILKKFLIYLVTKAMNFTNLLPTNIKYKVKYKTMNT